MLYVTLRQMEYVVAVAQAGSMSAAASALNISQPSLSVALTQVEARLGQSLFLRRKGAPLRLTAFATRYVAEAEAVLAMARRLEDPAAIKRLVNGTLTLGCFDDLAPSHLAPTLRHLRASLPGIELRWRIADFETLAENMAEGRIDLSLTYDLGLDSSFERTPLAVAAPHAFVAGDHRLVGRAEVSLADLAAEPLIVFEEGLSLRHWTQLFRRHGLSPVFAHRVRSLEVMRSLAGNGEGVGISYTLPPAQSSYDGATVRAVRIAEETANEPIILARRAMPATAVVQAGHAAICRRFRALPEGGTQE